MQNNVTVEIILQKKGNPLSARAGCGCTDPGGHPSPPAPRAGLLLILKQSHMIDEEAPRRGFSHESPPINQLVNRPTKFNSYS